MYPLSREDVRARFYRYPNARNGIGVYFGASLASMADSSPIAVRTMTSECLLASPLGTRCR